MEKTEPKMRINIYLKNGTVLTVKCDEFTVQRDGLGKFKGYSYEGAILPRPLYVDVTEIVAIEQDADTDW